jgi:intracellular septation protein
VSVTSKYAPWVRAGVDYAAPIAFVATLFITKDFQTATWVLVAASAVALLVGWIAERRLAPLPLFGGSMALIFGGLTLYFDDPKFVKMKLTFVEATLGLVLIGGVILRKNPLKILMGESLVLPDAAWRTLTLRYAAFFLACAALNEVIWRTQSDERWALWRLALLGLAVVFSITQAPFLMKHMQVKEDVAPPPTPPDAGF